MGIEYLLQTETPWGFTWKINSNVIGGIYQIGFKSAFLKKCQILDDFQKISENTMSFASFSEIDLSKYNCKFQPFTLFLLNLRGK